MFTGIVEEVGTIKELSLSGKSGRLRIQASRVLEGTKPGDSIAVNGICLTVTELQKDSFTADVMAETVRRSGLKNYSAGNQVNLERAMAADGRFGGHMVAGHIDGTGTVIEKRREENAVWLTVSAPMDIMELIVEKGSICIDGISLTVAAVSKMEFCVSIIPHTGSETTLLNRNKGEIVNLETDIVGKYIKKLLGIQTEEKKKTSGITMEFLEEYGI
ncbi:riboflavin synthase [Hespellia stercorisuis]|uniref:Riboflavin synthase n=1 Tax=Hespellia stercorisuis DSM 15480 TaxID=1121950 RepID=A0A1M6V5S9_9FIRM|nr:riboflavin synthase [Hespellia stercorisuis]SHK76764.1 riboflavin synthase alpha chain [Hespellia stercorisuis DSM 15480]